MVISFVRLDAKAASSSASTLNRKLPSGCSKPAGKARRASACSDGSSPIGAVFPNGSGIGYGCFLSTVGEHTALFPVFPLGGARAGAACRSSPWNFRKASAISHDAAFQKGIPRALPKHCQPSQSIKSLLPASPQANRPTGKTANRDSMNVKPLYVGGGRGALGKGPSPVIHYTFCNTQDTLPRMRPGQS